MKLAAVLIARDEARYLLEWFAHHRSLGFDYFFIYDNDSADGTGQILRRLARIPGVTVKRWPTREGHSPQRTAYNDALTSLKNRGIDYAAFIDADEILIPTAQVSIKDILLDLESSRPDFGALSICYRVFPSNGHERYVASPVLRRFPLRREPWQSKYVKSIYRVSHVETIMDPHRTALAVGSHYNAVGALLPFSSDCPGQVEAFDYSRVQTNHYIMKSREEFAAKRRRGASWSATADQRRTRYSDEFVDRYERGDCVRDEPTAAFAAAITGKLWRLNAEILLRSSLRRFIRPRAVPPPRPQSAFRDP